MNENPEDERSERVHLKDEYYCQLMEKILWYIHWDLAESRMPPSIFLPFLKHSIERWQAEEAALAEAAAIDN